MYFKRPEPRLFVRCNSLSRVKQEVCTLYEHLQSAIINYYYEDIILWYHRLKPDGAIPIQAG